MLHGLGRAETLIASFALCSSHIISPFYIFDSIHVIRDYIAVQLISMTTCSEYTSVSDTGRMYEERTRKNR
jgi:hypothetical protein